MTDIRQDPTGVRNHGAWTPVRGGGWQWTWGANPNPSLVGTYGADKLANPDRTPNGANTKAMNTPPPPDVRPPNVTDAWKGVAPDITGKLPGSEGTSNGQLTEPPAHPAFMVEPGTIRDAESFLLTVIDDQIAKYNNLKAYVAESHGQNLYNHGAGYEAITVPQHRLLLGIGDAIELAGQYTQMLNIAAQSYAKADINSFLPGT
jgi:hypothetical protein